jgi:hypothetical protein
LNESQVQMMVVCIMLDRECAALCRLAAQLMASGSARAPAPVVSARRHARLVQASVTNTTWSTAVPAPPRAGRARSTVAGWRRSATRGASWRWPAVSRLIAAANESPRAISVPTSYSASRLEEVRRWTTSFARKVATISLPRARSWAPRPVVVSRPSRRLPRWT